MMTIFGDQRFPPQADHIRFFDAFFLMFFNPLNPGARAKNLPAFPRLAMR